ncbi:MAG: ABC transporter permease [Planctomycetes bacterium]|nr:ABC transporter permease [Planctomycetota bacterium]
MTDAFGFAAAALSTQRRRTLLSLLGVTIGVAAVVLLTALGEGARGFVAAQFEGIGANVLAVAPGRVKTGGVPAFGHTTTDLSIADAVALRRALPHARAAAPLVVGVDEVAHGARARSAMLLGTTADMRTIRGLELASGAFLPEGDWDRGANVAVLGARTAAELFPGTSPLGAQVRVGDWRLRVVGVLRPRGLHMGADLDEAVFVPVATAMRMLDRRSLFRVLLMLRSPDELEAARATADRLLVERHGREDFTLITPDAIVAALQGILTVLTLALAGIAAISLCVAGVGIMNVMLVSVSERRAEIGLLKAVGAGRGQVVRLFLVEAALIAGAGGVLGAALGWALAGAVRGLFPQFPAEPPAWAVGAALSVSLLVGLAAGAWPARAAARLDPVAALARR